MDHNPSRGFLLNCKPTKIVPARGPKQCVRSISRKSRVSRDLDALGSREVMVVMKVGIIVTVAVSE